jgi:Flp pilus assembly protein TadG
MTSSKRPRAGSRGNSLLEFTLVGIPMIFLLISTFEMARGMWIYHTLVNSVKVGARYASVHGQLCATSPNTCTVTVAQVAAQVRNGGIGLDPTQLSLPFITQGVAPVSCVLNNCLSNSSGCPDPAGYSIGNTVEIDATYPFTSMISMFWPGRGSQSPTATIDLPASSKVRIQF